MHTFQMKYTQKIYSFDLKFGVSMISFFWFFLKAAYNFNQWNIWFNLSLNWSKLTVKRIKMLRSTRFETITVLFNFLFIKESWGKIIIISTIFFFFSTSVIIRNIFWAVNQYMIMICLVWKQHRWQPQGSAKGRANCPPHCWRWASLPPGYLHQAVYKESPEDY